jgi:hypothetical protein
VWPGLRHHGGRTAVGAVCGCSGGNRVASQGGHQRRGGSLDVRAWVISWGRAGRNARPGGVAGPLSPACPSLFASSPTRSRFLPGLSLLSDNPPLLLTSGALLKSEPRANLLTVFAGWTNKRKDLRLLGLARVEGRCYPFRLPLSAALAYSASNLSCSSSTASASAVAFLFSVPASQTAQPISGCKQRVCGS